MEDSVNCIRCHTQMESGFVPDSTYGGSLEQGWAAGDPKSSFWTGVKVDRSRLLAITVFRCPKCGYLESYAREQAVRR